MSTNDDYTVIIPYVIRGQAVLKVRAIDRKEARIRALQDFMAGDCNHDIGVRLEGSATSVDESLIEATKS